MAQVYPFRAVRYDENAVGDLSAVVTPPYDVIRTSQQQAFYERHPYNIIRAELSREEREGEDRYQAAARFLAEARAGGVLRRDPAPAFYLYEQEFADPETGGLLRRLGVLGLTRLEPLGEGAVFPHERTFPKQKEDRLALMRACRANISPVFSFYDDADGKTTALLRAAAASAPDIDLTDDAGTRHRVWVADDRETVSAIHGAMESKPLFIADGHHRYETALEFSRLMREADPHPSPDKNYNHAFMLMVALQDPGLVVRPTHRLLAGLARADRAFLAEKLAAEFTVRPVEKDRMFDALAEAGRKSPAFALYTEGGACDLLLLRDPDAAFRVSGGNLPVGWNRVDSAILETVVIRHLLGVELPETHVGGPLRFVSNAEAAFGYVDRGESQCAFFMNPPSLKQIMEISKARGVMPQKTTFFYPKALTGLLFHQFDLEDSVASPCGASA